MNPVSFAADIFFRRQVRLRWRGGPRVELTERPSGEPTPSELAAARQRDELAQMQQELAALLDDMPEIRDAVRHLAYVEQALAQDGLSAMHRVPLEVLEQALDQFEGLVSNWSPRGLANLRSKMAVAALERERQADASQPAMLPPRIASPSLNAD